MEENKDQVNVSLAPGLAVLGCFIVGILGVVFALNSENPIGLIPSAIAFGAVAIASYR